MSKKMTKQNKNLLVGIGLAAIVIIALLVISGNYKYSIYPEATTLGVGQQIRLRYICDLACQNSGGKLGDAVTWTYKYSTDSAESPLSSGTLTCCLTGGLVDTQFISPLRQGTLYVYAKVKTSTGNLVSESTTLTVSASCTNDCSSGQTKCISTHRNNCQLQGTCYKWVDVGIDSTCYSCPVCPSPGSWSSCSNGVQTRTDYMCGVATNYQCSSFTVTQACVSPCLSECCDAGSGFQPTFCPSGYGCSGGICKANCVPNNVCQSWGICQSGIQSRICDDGCGRTITEQQGCTTPEVPVCTQPQTTCENWGQCQNGLQYRSCADPCGLVAAHVESQSCNSDIFLIVVLAGLAVIVIFGVAIFMRMRK